MGFQVYKEPCKNCLLSKDSIVSPARRKEIINKVTIEQTYFVCHKATMNEVDVCCKTFYDKLGQHSQMIRIAERLNAVDFIELPDNEKLPTYSEMKSKNLKRSL